MSDQNFKISDELKRELSLKKKRKAQESSEKVMKESQSNITACKSRAGAGTQADSEFNFTFNQSNNPIHQYLSANNKKNSQGEIQGEQRNSKSSSNACKKIQLFSLQQN